MEIETSCALALLLMNTNKKKLILIRLDKIGDLICTLPVDEIFGSEFEITWVISKGLSPLTECANPPRRYIQLDKTHPREAAQELKAFLKKEKFDLALSFQAPWWVNFQLWLQRIPLRLGVLSQWHSFLFLNQGLRQKRSRAEKHEYEYSLDLALLAKELLKSPLSPLEKDKSLTAYLKLKPRLNSLSQFDVNQNFVVVHPGMMGSALNWPEEKYIQWIESFLKLKKDKVVITGTDKDEPYLKKIKSTFAQHPQVIVLQSQLNFDELLLLLSKAQLVLAPSTGVAHLAASLGTKVKAIFSPLRVHHPLRWSPRGPFVKNYLPQGPSPIDDEEQARKMMETIEVDL